MRAVVKSHKDLKGTKVFAFGRSVRNLKNLQEPLLESFIPVMLQSGIAYKKNQSKGYFGNFIKKRRLHRKNTFL